jgi:hypothetical protein
MAGLTIYYRNDASLQAWNERTQRTAHLDAAILRRDKRARPSSDLNDLREP